MWKWLTIFAYRRWTRVTKQKPVGIPGNRDPQSPCRGYEPRKKQLGDWGDCETDGHYLCQECCHKRLEED